MGVIAENKNTDKAYWYQVTKFMDWTDFWTRKETEVFTTENIENYVTYLKGKSLSASTINIAIRAIRKWAEVRGANTDFKVTNAPKLKEPQFTYIRADEVKSLLETRCRYLKEKAVLLLCYDCGLMPRQIADLEINDVDMNNRTITVNEQQILFSALTEQILKTLLNGYNRKQTELFDFGYYGVYRTITRLGKQVTPRSLILSRQKDIETSGNLNILDKIEMDRQKILDTFWLRKVDGKNIHSYDILPDEPDITITPEYIVGFVDGEGSFIISIRKRKDKDKTQVSLTFSATQAVKRGRDILRQIQKYFDVGVVTKQKRTRQNHSTIYKYQVQSFKDIFNVIIPFFDAHVPIIKREDYGLWRTAAWLIKEKQHLTKEGFYKIKSLESKLNSDSKHKTKNTVEWRDE